MASSFIESEWIGLGKEYDIIKIPEHVSEAKKQLLKILDAVKATIPHNTMSYMVIQFYELILRTVQFGEMAFRDRPDQLSLLQAKEYGLMTLSQFLTVLLQKPTSTPTGLYLSESDSASFSSLDRWSPLLKKAAEDFKKRSSTKDSELLV